MRFPCGPAAVRGSDSAVNHWETGKVQNDNDPEPEDLLALCMQYLRAIGYWTALFFTDIYVIILLFLAGQELFILHPYQIQGEGGTTI